MHHAIGCAAAEEHQLTAQRQAEPQHPQLARRQLLLSAAAAMASSQLWGGREQPAMAAGAAAGSPQPLRGDVKAAVDQALAKAMDKSKVRTSHCLRCLQHILGTAPFKLLASQAAHSAAMRVIHHNDMSP